MAETQSHAVDVDVVVFRRRKLFRRDIFRRPARGLLGSATLIVHAGSLVLKSSEAG
jgi:hypothetical protein